MNLSAIVISFVIGLMVIAGLSVALSEQTAPYGKDSPELNKWADIQNQQVYKKLNQTRTTAANLVGSGGVVDDILSGNVFAVFQDLLDVGGLFLGILEIPSSFLDIFSGSWFGLPFWFTATILIIVVVLIAFAGLDFIRGTGKL